MLLAPNSAPDSLHPSHCRAPLFALEVAAALVEVAVEDLVDATAGVVTSAMEVVDATADVAELSFEESGVELDTTLAMLDDVREAVVLDATGVDEELLWVTMLEATVLTDELLEGLSLATVDLAVLDATDSETKELEGAVPTRHWEYHGLE